MKEQSDSIVPLVRMSQDEQITRWTAPGGVQHDQREGYQEPITFRTVCQNDQVEIKIVVP